MTEITNISTFSADHVVRLTGLSMRQLSYWDNPGFFRPQYAASIGRRPFRASTRSRTSCYRLRSVREGLNASVGS